jgi:hypothetical protein
MKGVQTVFIVIFFLPMVNLWAADDCYEYFINFRNETVSLCPLHLVEASSVYDVGGNCAELEENQNIGSLSTLDCRNIGEWDEEELESEVITGKDQPELALAFLIAMQNSEKEFTEKDVEVFLGIIHSSFYKKYPRLISRALMNLYIHQRELYAQLVKDHPQLLEIDSSKGTSFCALGETITKDDPSINSLVSEIISNARNGIYPPLPKEWPLKKINKMTNDEMLEILKMVESDLDSFETDLSSVNFQESFLLTLEDLMEDRGSYALLPKKDKDRVFKKIMKIMDKDLGIVVPDNIKEIVRAGLKKYFYHDAKNTKDTLFITNSDGLVVAAEVVNEQKEGYEWLTGYPNVFYKEYKDEDVLSNPSLLNKLGVDKEGYSAKLKKEVLNYFKMLAKGNFGDGSTLHDWKKLLTERNLKGFSQAEKEELIDIIASDFVENADSANNNIIDNSSLYYFSYNALAPIFGIEKKDLVKFDTLPNDENSIDAVLASSSPIDGVEENEYGFYLSRTPLFNHFVKKEESLVPSDPTEQPSIKRSRHQIPLEFKQGEKQYKVELDVVRSKAFVPIKVNQESPDYKEIDKNGKVGIIVVGSNYTEANEAILQNVINFYTQEQGYIPYSSRQVRYQPGGNVIDYYKSQMSDIKDTKSFVKSQIENGSADYFVKLEHNLGNTTNLFNPAKKSKLLSFYKPGTKDRLYLLIPSHDNQPQSVSAQEFGHWIKKRKGKSKNPLDLFSGSCDSDTQTQKMMGHFMAQLKNENEEKLPVTVYPTTSSTSFNIGDKNSASVASRKFFQL